MGRFAPYGHPPVLAVAVSGGPDSLALTLLADGWARSMGGRIEAVTVDHRLRPESAKEARLLGQALGERGISHTILTIDAALPPRDVQAAARAARYRLLQDFCVERGILHLAVAHHREDQAETFLIRLARGSGVDGLAAMSPATYLPEIRILRPLLAIPKARLVATCTQFSAIPFDDSSNHSDRFLRVRIRRMASSLSQSGLSAERLAMTALHLATARAALEEQTVALMVRAVSFHPAGFVTVALGDVADASEEIRLRLLAAVLRVVSGEALRPRFERLERLSQAVAEGGRIDRTLGGCRLVELAGNRMLVHREVAAMAVPQALVAGSQVWDQRFRVDVEGQPQSGWMIGALGAGGVTKLRRQGVQGLETLPARVLPTLPCLRHLEDIKLLPHLTYCREAGLPDTMPTVVISPQPGLAAIEPSFLV